MLRNLFRNTPVMGAATAVQLMFRHCSRGDGCNPSRSGWATDQAMSKTKSRLLNMGSVVDEVAQGQLFLRVLRFLIPPMIHNLLFSSTIQTKKFAEVGSVVRYTLH